MSTHHASFTLDDGREVEVEANVVFEIRGLPPRLEDIVARTEDGIEIDLSDAEAERLEEEIGENPPTD